MRESLACGFGGVITVAALALAGLLLALAVHFLHHPVHVLVHQAQTAVKMVSRR